VVVNDRLEDAVSELERIVRSSMDCDGDRIEFGK
jgi:hypothetical protein